MAKLNNYIIFDFETGGIDKEKQLHAQKFAITQCAFISVYADSFKEILRYESYIKGQFVNNVYVGYDPKLSYQNEALKFTGITVDKLEKSGMKAKDVVDDIINLFKASHSGGVKKPILVGHNVTYDIPFLQYIFLACKKNLSQYLDGSFDNAGNFMPTYIDTLYLSRAKWPQESLKNDLSSVCSRLGIEIFDAHSAMNDTIATLEVFKRFISFLQSDSITNDNVVSKDFREDFKFEM